MRRWCEVEAAAAGGGGDSVAGLFPLQKTAQLLCALPPLPPDHLTSRAWLEAQPWEPTPHHDHHQQAEGREDKTKASNHQRNPVTADGPKLHFTDPQLDALALLFTAAKVLFAGGALAAAAALCRLLVPIQRACAVELHTTAIRNEAAYFGCVCGLLLDRPPPAWPLVPSLAPRTSGGAEEGRGGGGGGVLAAGVVEAPLLFVLGDSHTLPPAWRHVNLRGQRHLLHPLLVTGVKIWHLREDGSFYPKQQFWNTVSTLADGSKVVLVLGEIDCREGVVQAVERLKVRCLMDGLSSVRWVIGVLRLAVITPNQPTAPNQPN